MHWNRFAGAAAAAIALTTLAAACSSNSTGAAGSTAGGGASASTLTIAASTGGPFPDNLNPVAPVSGLSDAVSFVYEPLLQFDKLKPGTVNPWLATGYSWSDGGKTLTFTIRGGVKWSDGQPFTAKDVAFTYSYVKANPAVNTEGLVISSVSAPTASTVVLTFATPQYANLYYIGSQLMLPRHIWQGIANPANATNLHPVGTGPYTVASFTPQDLTLRKNPDYWQPGKPAVAQIVFPSTVDNNGPGLALSQGNADWGGIFFPEAKTWVAKDPSTNHYWFPPMSNTVLLLNLTKYPMNLLPFRQAINLALNRAAVSQAATLGLVPPVTNPTMLTPYQSAYLNPRYAGSTLVQNVAAAKAGLLKAGFTYSGSTLLDPHGHPVSLTLTNPGPLSDLVASGQEVARELSAIGINITQVSASVAEWQGNQADGNYDIALRPSVAGPGPYYMYNYWLNGALTAPVGKTATADFARWNDPTTNQLLTEYASTDNPALQKSIMYQLETIVVNDLPVIPLQYQAFWGEYSSKDVTGWPDPSNPYALASVYDTPANEMVILNLKPKS
jgi:peptide/nickel transport system substrate-binding protein